MTNNTTYAGVHEPDTATQPFVIAKDAMAAFASTLSAIPRDPNRELDAVDFLALAVINLVERAPEVLSESGEALMVRTPGGGGLCITFFQKQEGSAGATV